MCRTLHKHNNTNHQEDVIMKTVQISLNSIDKVKNFVNDLTKFNTDFDLVSGRYVVDAKSIMGIFSLDLSKPIKNWTTSLRPSLPTSSPDYFSTYSTLKRTAEAVLFYFIPAASRQAGAADGLVSAA